RLLFGMVATVRMESPPPRTSFQDFISQCHRCMRRLRWLVLIYRTTWQTKKRKVRLRNKVRDQELKLFPSRIAKRKKLQRNNNNVTLANSQRYRLVSISKGLTSVRRF